MCIIQERLQVIVECVLRKSQSGLRKVRGRCGMIFVARQLLEKTQEHQDFLFALFVDLRKAYTYMTLYLETLCSRCWRRVAYHPGY